MIFAILKARYNMNHFHKILLPSLLLSLLLLPGLKAEAQSNEFDVFIPISKYLSQGDAASLSAWFADNLEVSIEGKSYNSSKTQARQIVRSFLDTNPPRAFSISHTAGKNNLKYAIGTLKTGDETYMVTIFVNIDNSNPASGYKIQHLTIEPMQ